MMSRAESIEEIKPLIDFCRLGQLFEVQEWISSGKPISSPECKAGRRPKYPVEIAIDSGFHSLVKVLIEAGSIRYDEHYNALEHALSVKRFDIIELLVDYGHDVKQADMYNVLETWDPIIIEYFIEHGADLETNYPLAWALCEKIRTCLGVIKRHRDNNPSFQEQIDIALRYHCKDGNVKWASLLLWAGADPFSKGPCSPAEDADEDEDICALEYAAIYGHVDIFNLKKINIRSNAVLASNVLRYACLASAGDFVCELLGSGVELPHRGNGEADLIHQCLVRLEHADINWWISNRDEGCFDNSKSRELLKIIHALAKHGARWDPADNQAINSARRSLLKMDPDYTVEFVWIMSKFQACSLEPLKQLLKTPAIRRHVERQLARINELIGNISY